MHLQGFKFCFIIYFSLRAKTVFYCLDYVLICMLQSLSFLLFLQLSFVLESLNLTYKYTLCNRAKVSTPPGCVTDYFRLIKFFLCFCLCWGVHRLTILLWKRILLCSTWPNLLLVHVVCVFLAHLVSFILGGFSSPQCLYDLNSITRKCEYYGLTMVEYIKAVYLLKWLARH